MTPKPIRLNLVLPASSARALEARALVESRGKAEVVRRAIHMYVALGQAFNPEAGDVLIVRGPDGTERQVVIL